MEKKTKKLQLRKETIAVLNGERMNHVVGGGGIEPNPDDPTGFLDDTRPMKCPDGLAFNPEQTVCDIAASRVICLSIAPQWDCGGSKTCNAFPVCIPVSGKKC